MPALIVGLIVLVLYVMLIYWLFTVVAPELLVLGSVLGTGLVPVVYGMVVYRLLNVQSWRRVFWIPIFVLLALVYADLALIVLRTLEGVMRARVTLALDEVLRAIVQLPGNRPGIATWTRLFGPPRFLWLYVLIGTAVKGVLVVGLLLAIRGFRNNVPAMRQPAFRQYFFGQALLDLRAVTRETATRFSELVEATAKWILAISTGPQAWFVWPLTLTAYVTLLPPVVAAGIAMGILLAIHAAGIALASALTIYLSTMLFCVERAVMLARSGYAKCPHAGCHAPVPLPIFYCPECGNAHDRLVPGACGVFRRACSCGEASLPTTFWLGKGKYRSACASCKKPLHEELFGGSVHVPIYGGVGSGKTMLMMGATWQLMQGQLDDVHAAFIEERDRTSYDTVWKPSFESGRVREKTHQMLPDAFLLSVRRASGLPISLYMYDPAGEAIEHESDIEGHRFLRYFDGLALLIDPFSLPSFANAHREAGLGSLPATTSQADPMEVVQRVVNVLESQAVLARGRNFRRRVAVILTKADDELVQRELGFTLDGAGPGARWQDAGRDDDEHIRTWLQANEPGLLQLLETRFAVLRFFAVSALGHDPSVQKGFQPRKVLDPLCWLLAARGTLTRPLVARFVGRGAEVGAALIVLAAFLAPAYVLARSTLHFTGVLR